MAVSQQFLQQAMPTLGPVQVGFVLLWLVLVGSALGVVYSTHKSRLLIHELELARTESAQLQVAWGQYLLEQSTWAAYHRIEYVAASQLDMYVPAMEDMIVVK